MRLRQYEWRWYCSVRGTSPAITTSCASVPASGPSAASRQARRAAWSPPRGAPGCGRGGGMGPWDAALCLAGERARLQQTAALPARLALVTPNTPTHT